MLTLGRSYEAHRKKLTEIREGRHKPPLQHDFGSDPTLELSKVNLSRHKLVNRHFQATGITLRGERVERLLGMERETKALVNRLEDIQRGKLVFGNRGRAGIEFDTNTTEPDERCVGEKSQRSLQEEGERASHAGEHEDVRANSHNVRRDARK